MVMKMIIRQRKDKAVTVAKFPYPVYAAWNINILLVLEISAEITKEAYKVYNAFNTSNQIGDINKSL